MSSRLDNPTNEPTVESPASVLSFIVGFYFAFRVITVLFLARTIGADPRTGTAVNLATDYFLLLLSAFCSVERRYSFGEMAKLPGIRWALLFLGFSCCSLMWSRTASLADSVAYWCGMASDFAIVALLFRSGEIERVSRSLMKGFVWGTCAVAAIAWVLPAQSDLRLGDEELLGPNQIGYVCAFGFFFAQYLIREKREKMGVPAAILAITVLRALSKTTIAAFLAGEGFLLLMDKKMNRRTKTVLVIGTLAAVALFWGLLTSYYGVYTHEGNQSETLSGRLGIWVYFLAEAVQRPWIGNGFDSAWKVIPPFGPDQFEAAHAHNELLQQFYAYGVAGVLLFMGIYGSLFRRIRRLAKGPTRTFFLAFLILVLVRGITDTERFDLSLPLWAIAMVSILVERSRATVKEPYPSFDSASAPTRIGDGPSSEIVIPM
jgi:hypothetical protein